MLLRFRSILKANRFMRAIGSRNILPGALRAICFLTHRRHPFKPVEPSAHYVRLCTGAAYDSSQQTYAVAPACTSEKTKGSNTIRRRERPKRVPFAFCKATPSSHSVVSRFGQVYPHTNVRHLKIPLVTRRVNHDDSPFARAHHIFSSSGNSGLVFGGFIL